VLRTNPAVCMEGDEYEPRNWCSVIVWANAVLARTLLRSRFGGRQRRPDRDSANAPSPVAFRIRSRSATGRRASHLVKDS